MKSSGAPRARGRRWQWALLLLAGSGCATAYQPLGALQRPVLVDVERRNFEGLRVALNCASGESMARAQAERLCRNVGLLLNNQGAIVELPPARRGDDAERTARRADVQMELTSRLVRQDNSVLGWILSIASATLIPATTDTTLALDVTIRDRDGAILVSDSLQARFVRSFGLLAWAVSALVDVIARPPEEQTTGAAVGRQVSKDLYGQLSQLLLHAHLRAEVLGSYAGVAPPKGAP